MVMTYKIIRVDTFNHDNHIRKARISLAMIYSKLCLSLVLQGFTVVIATISLFREVHK